LKCCVPENIKVKVKEDAPPKVEKSEKKPKGDKPKTDRPKTEKPKADAKA
jgi:hypothetical protein